MDNLGYTPGAGAIVATDEVAGSHFQRMKLDIGADGLSDPVIGAMPTVPSNPMALDSFGRHRVSEPIGLFSAQSQYDAEPFLFESGASGTGVAPSHSAVSRMTALTVNAGVGESYIQSYEYIPYQPGKSQLVKLTGVFGGGVAGVVKEIGLGDLDNAILYRQNGTSGVQMVLRTKISGTVVEHVVDKADWSVNPAIAIDEANNFILVADMQYLGMGMVRVGFNVHGENVAVHEFDHAGLIATPYMQTLTLPVGMRVVADGSVAPATAHFKCAAVESEGGFENPSAYAFSTPRAGVVAANGVRTALLSIRPRTTFNGITNRSRIGAESLDLLVTGNSPVYWELSLGASFSVAPTWGNVNAASSAVEYTSAPGTLSAVGTVIASGFVAVSASVKSAVNAKLAARYPLTLDRAGLQRPNGTLTLSVTGIGGTSQTDATVGYTELR